MLTFGFNQLHDIQTNCYFSNTNYFELFRIISDYDCKSFINSDDLSN